jgi:ribosomal protein S18 acetylase RimI-like enzyme
MVMDSNLLTSMDANLALHASHLHRRTPGMTVIDSVDVVIADSGLADDTFNVVTAAHFTSENADRRIAETLDHLAQRRPYSWWVGPSSTPSDLSQRLRAAGLRHTATEAAMCLDLAQLPVPVPVAGLEVRRVTTTEQLRDFATVVAGGSPAETMVRFYNRTAVSALTADAPARYFVGYVDGVAACASEVFYGAGLAGLYNVVTLSEYRRRGCGAALTVAPLLLARDDGCRIAVLQASTDGEPLYRRLGFESVGTYREHAVEPA